MKKNLRTDPMKVTAIWNASAAAINDNSIAWTRLLAQIIAHSFLNSEFKKQQKIQNATL